VKKTGNFHTCHNTKGPKAHHTYIDTLETACPNVDPSAPLLDTNLATKGIMEHTLVQLALKHRVGTNEYQVAQGLIYLNNFLRVLSQLKLPWLSRINQHKSTPF